MPTRVPRAVVAFNGEINAARDVTKTNTYHLQTFRTPPARTGTDRAVGGRRHGEPGDQTERAMITAILDGTLRG